MQTTVPLVLSICIPTFNRGQLLDVCLASVLPQVACFSQVECVVSDNASTDQTAAIIEKYAQQFRFRAHRNQENIGLLGNITFTASQLAHGQYVWMLGDDDILAAGAVAQVVELLASAPEIDLVALNVGYFAFEKRPQSQAALGGMRDTPHSLLRQSAKKGIIPFEQLLEGPNANFTAMYASVLRQQLWADEFKQPILDGAFTSVRTTYPHAFLIASKMPGKLAGVLPEPLVYIYEMPSEQFSWKAFHALTVVLHATSLIELFEQRGVPRSVLEPYYQLQLNSRGSDLGNLIWDQSTAGGWREAARFAWKLRRYPLGLLKVFVVACGHPKAPKLLSWPIQQLLKWRSSRKRLVEN